MKKLFIYWLILLSWVAPVSAKTMYTSDITEISVRKGRDITYPVIATLKSGQEVTVLESAQGWSKIKYSGGKIGWLVSSYLTEDKPEDGISSQFNKKIADLSMQMQAVGEENERLKKQNKLLESRLEDTKKNPEIKNAAQGGNPLEAPEFKALKDKFDEVSAEAAQKTKKINELEKQLAETGNGNSEYKCYLYLFLAGAGVLLLGMIIGSSTRRRRSSLY